MPNFLFFHINDIAMPSNKRNIQLLALCADGLPFGKVGMGFNDYSAAIPAFETLSN
jgi:hypothetical protein